MLSIIFAVSIFTTQLLTGKAVDAAIPVPVTINAPSQANVGGSFTVTVNIGQVSNFFGAQFDILYDSTVLQYISTTWGQIGTTQISGSGTAQSNTLSGGRRFLISLNNLQSGISGSGTMAAIEFNVVGTAQQTVSLNLTNGIISDFNANAIAATWTGSSVTIMATTATTITTIPTTTTLATPAVTTTTVATTTTTTTNNATTTTVVPTNPSTTIPTVTTMPTTTVVTTTTALTTTTTTPVITVVTGAGTVDVSNDVTAGGKVIAPVILSSADNNAIIDIPAGISGTMSDGTPLSWVTVIQVSKPPAPPPSGESIVSIPYDFGPSGAHFSSPITMMFSYDPTKIASGFPETSLVVAYYSVSEGQWVTLGGVVDTVNHTITVQVDHFTVFSVIQGVTTTTSKTQKLNPVFIVIVVGIFVEMGLIVFFIKRKRIRP